MSHLVGSLPDQQREDEGVRRAGLLNDGFVCLAWLETRRVQGSFVRGSPGHCYWKHPRLFVLLSVFLSAELSHGFSTFPSSLGLLHPLVCRDK